MTPDPDARPEPPPPPAWGNWAPPSPSAPIAAPDLPPGPVATPVAERGGHAVAFAGGAVALAVALVVARNAVVDRAARPDGTITTADGSETSESGVIDADVAAGPTIDGEPLPLFDPDATELGDPAIGRPIPTITGTNYLGDAVTIGPGEPLIIVVMAHWCPHCQREIPAIVRWNADGMVDSDVRVVGISTAVDARKGNFPPPSWLERERWPFEVLADGSDAPALRAVGADAFPTLIAVGADGRIVMRASGESTPQRFRALVAAASRGAAV